MLRFLHPLAARTMLQSAFFIAAVGASSIAVADSIRPIGDGWQTYLNSRFGTHVDFPAGVFTPGEQPEKADGMRFFALDATLEVYAWNNVGHETARTLKQRLLGSEKYTNVTYGPSGSNWLVLSGFRGDRIFYEKYLFRGNVVHGFGMEFPAAAKPRYAPIIERMEDSFHAS